jgi:hypothetical protein
MEIIAFVESDDCGPAAILDSDFISIMKCDGFYLGATRCVFRGTPITCELSEQDAIKLMAKGVNCIELESYTK